jgi:alpha-D-xyloside xylohydrolase
MRGYVRGLMRAAHETGAPLIRPMFYEFPLDDCWECKDQYMFGGDVLVAPVLYPGMKSRTVYLPSGSFWTKLGTSERFDGGQRITVDTPMDGIPVFLKSGSHSEWRW